MAKKGVKWLHQDEWLWAERYLRERAPRGLLSIQLGSPSHDKTMQIIEDLGQHTDGLRLIERLKNALRQRRYRSPSNGRLACTFSLPNTTAKTLTRLAKFRNQAETSIVTKLIDDFDSITREQQTQAKQQNAVMRLERNAANQANSLLRTQLDEVMKHLERHMELLVMWETSMKTDQPPFNGDEAKAREEVEKRMNRVQRSLKVIAFKHNAINERLI